MIGSWVARVHSWDGGDSVTTKAHLVESEIEGRVVTRCGRQMEAHTRRGRLVADEWVSRIRCLLCE